MSWHMYIYIGLHELKTQQLVQLVIQILCMKFREILEEKILLLEYSCKERWRLRIDDGVLSLHLKSSKKKIKDIKIFAQKLQTKGRHMGKIHILQSYIKLSYSKPQTNNLICACKKSVCYSNLWQVYDCQKASISMHAEIQARERRCWKHLFEKKDAMHTSNLGTNALKDRATSFQVKCLLGDRAATTKKRGFWLSTVAFNPFNNVRMQIDQKSLR